MTEDMDCSPTRSENDDVAQRITRALGNYSNTADVTWVARFPAERIARALGLDPAMPLAELQRKNPCSCPIMTKAVYRDCLDWELGDPL